MKLLCYMLASCSLAAADMNSTTNNVANGFRAFDSYETMIEGGTARTMVVEAGREHLVTRLPRGYAAAVDTGAKSIVFNEDTGIIPITLRVTTNSPGIMPDDDTLRTNALAADPGGAVIQVAGCATGYKPARFVDTTRGVDAIHNIRTRHAFVACPEGMVEFIFSSKDQDFDKGRVIFNLFLSSFRLEMIEQDAVKVAK
jgi:hypothetical protein